jgi:hypothetical protein
MEVSMFLDSYRDECMAQVFGESRVNVHALFEQLRKQGELTLIGAETGVVENKWKRWAPFHCYAH